MRYRIEYADGRCCNYVNSRKDLLDWLKALKDEKIVDIRKVYKNGVTDSVMWKQWLWMWLLTIIFCWQGDLSLCLFIFYRIIISSLLFMLPDIILIFHIPGIDPVCFLFRVHCLSTLFFLFHTLQIYLIKSISIYNKHFFLFF